MAVKKITASELERLPPRRHALDTETRGFGARRQAESKGADITFIWKGLAPKTGRQIFMTIGRWGRGDWTLDKARVKATEYRDAVRLGRDPAAARDEAKAARMTMAELCDAYVTAMPEMLIGRAGRPKKPSTIGTDKSRIKAHIKPLLGKLLVEDVTAADVETFMQRVERGASAKPLTAGRGSPVTGGRGAASRTVGLLGAIFGYAVKRRLRPDNPVRGVLRPADGRRERRLTAEEYAALGKALAVAREDGQNIYGVAAIRFLALTGWRRGEAITLTWDAVDAVRRTARLGDTKTGASTRPLAHAALDAIRDLPRRAHNPHVFPALSGEGPLASLPKVFRAVRGKAGLPAEHHAAHVAA